MVESKNMTFGELEKEVEILKLNFPLTPAWNVLKSNLLVPESISKLISCGWTFGYIVSSDPPGFANPETKKIKIAGELKNPYLRDKILLHEIVHAIHHPQLSDGWMTPEESARRNNIIVEWVSRKARANPDLLRTAVLGFGLTPEVYDSASYDAFEYHPDKRQLEFEFSQEYRNIRIPLMD